MSDEKEDKEKVMAVSVSSAAAAEGPGEKLEKCYFEVLGLCCSSEAALIERILKPLEGVKEVNVIVPSKTVVVVLDSFLISSHQIVRELNKASLEANVRVRGVTNHRNKWPRPYVIASGVLLALSFFKYLYQPFQWLALAAVAMGIAPILMRGLAAIRNFTLDVNILMVVAVTGTIALRDFLEAGSIVFLFTIAQWLESRASHRANAVMSSLMNVTPVRAIIAETGESVDVHDVKLNTTLAVKAGETVPLDGVVVEGNAEVDEKMLTGESFPVNKEKNSIVFAGAILLNGYISVNTTALVENCVVARMAELVEEAHNNNSKTQRLLHKCSKYYMPVVVLISACFAAIPVTLRVPNQRHWFHLALVVLVSACPCGLILSTPVATFCAMSKAATFGLLFKGGDYLEILAKPKVVAFDKTGTITKGEFLLTDFCSWSNDVSVNTLLYWVASIESKSSHPIAAAIVDYAESLSIRPKPENVQEFQNFPGEGICGKIDGNEIYVGNKKFGLRAGYVTSREIEDAKMDGRSCGYIYSSGALIGSFCLSDTCRLGAMDAIKDLNSRGIRTAMLTGDSHAAAMHAQNELGQALSAVHAELLPEEKAKIIQEFKKAGPTVMVGDGVNDALALATANIGISMGVSGSALASETGHVILMSNDIRKIPKAIHLANKTRRKVFENIIFSVSVKAGVLALAFAGHPLVWLAVLADVVTCLLVICNSMLLLRGYHNHGQRKQKCHISHSLKECSISKKTTCESLKCSSQKCAGSFHSVERKGDASEHHPGCGKQHQSCCSQDICQAMLVVCKSQECATSCEGIFSGENSCRIKRCMNSDPEKDCREAVTCHEKSCCANGGCFEDMVENQFSCQADEYMAEGKCLNHGNNDIIEHEVECGGGLHCPFKQLGDPSTSADAVNMHHNQHKLKCRGEERVIDKTKHEELEIKRQTCARSKRSQKIGFKCQAHCSRVHQQGNNLHVVSQLGYVDTVANQACIGMGNREIDVCCRSFRQECCTHGNFAGFGGNLTEIVIEKVDRKSTVNNSILYGV